MSSLRTTPRVSVVIPTRDRCERLATTLAMVLDQTVRPHEVLVVVDGSSDRTAEYLIETKAQTGVRVIVNPRPTGVAAARNRGIEEATGDWVAFTDDDDLWVPRKLELQLAALDRYPAARWSTVTSVSVRGGFDVRLVRQAPPTGWIDAAVLAGNVVPGGGSGVLADLALVREAGGFDTRLRVLADWDLWVRLALRSPQAAVSDPMVIYMLHDDNMSRDTTGCLDELATMRANYAELLGEQATAGLGVETLRWIARVEARSGDTRTARRLLLREAARTRLRHPALLAHAAVTLAGPAGRRALDALRARYDRYRGGPVLQGTVADLQWRAEHGETGVSSFIATVEPTGPVGPPAPEVSADPVESDA